MNTEIREIVLQAVARTAKVDPKSLGDNTSLGSGGLGLDSISTLEMLLAIEAEAGIRLRSETLTSDDLMTLGGMLRYIQSL